MKKLEIKKVICIVLSLLILVSLFGCASQKNQLVGKWEHKGSEPGNFPDEVEFFSDYSCDYDSWGGNYSVDGNRLLCEVGADAYTFTYEIKDGKLYLTDDKGETYEYIKYGEDNGAGETVSTTETTSQEVVKLSSECDEVLCMGVDKNGDEYELVKKDESDFEKKAIKIGVIKNNKWLVPLSLDNPFVDKESGDLSFDLKYSDIVYLGNGNFLIIQKGNSFGAYSMFCKNLALKATFYNANKNISFKYNQNDDEGKYYGYVIYDENCNVPQSPIVFYENGTGLEFFYVNTDTMKLEKINGKFAELYKNAYREYLLPVSDNAFFVEYNMENEKSDIRHYSFYDIDGNLLVDLSKYRIEEKGYFVDGKCEFKAKGADDKIYKITIDKNGNELSKELAAEE